MKKRKSLKSRGLKLLMFVLVALVIFAYPIAYYTSSETIEVTINNKERITTGSGESISSKFLVYSENEVFENIDSWMFMKFSSADIQNALKEDSTYTVKVVGWRVPFFSWYRNVITIK